MTGRIPSPANPESRAADPDVPSVNARVPSPRVPSPSPRVRASARLRRRPSTGLDPNFAAALAYLAGPFSGILILLVERANAYVRFHAWQAIVGLGGLGALAVGVLVLSFLTLLLSPFVFTVMYRLSEADCRRVGRRVGDLPGEGVHRECVADAVRGGTRRLAATGLTAARAAPRQSSRGACRERRHSESRAGDSADRGPATAALAVPGLRSSIRRAYWNFLTALTSMLPFACEKAHWG